MAAAEEAQSMAEVPATEEAPVPTERLAPAEVHAMVGPQTEEGQMMPAWAMAGTEAPVEPRGRAAAEALAEPRVLAGAEALAEA